MKDCQGCDKILVVPDITFNHLRNLQSYTLQLIKPIKVSSNQLFGIGGGGGGGGARPPNVQTGKKKSTVWICVSERLRNIYIFRSHSTSVYIYNQCSSLLLLVVWQYKQQHTNKNTNIEKIYVYMRASELRKFWHFYILKLLFPSIFCWYFRYFVSGT